MLPLLVVLQLLIAPAQVANGIRGQVLLPTTASQGRIEVVLEKSGAFLQRTYSDNEGHFRFINLPDGEYVVIVNLDGYEEAREKPHFSRDGSATMSITMVRKAGGEPARRLAPDAVFPRKIVDDYERALAESRKGNTAEAIQLLESVIQVEPGFQQAHNALGTLFQKTQHFQEADEEYNAAHQIDPDFPEPLLNLGSLYIQIAGQAQEKRDTQTAGIALEGAARALNLAAGIDPLSATAYYLLGTTYYMDGQLAEAEQSLMRALRIQAGMGKAELVLANVYIKQQKWKQALEYLDAYLSDNPNAADRDQIQQTRTKVSSRNN
jgi:Tfp pilus assembly protein PilF